MLLSFKAGIFKTNNRKETKTNLTAWTRILLGRGEIDTQKYNRMLVLIDKLTTRKSLFFTLPLQNPKYSAIIS